MTMETLVYLKQAVCSVIYRSTTLYAMTYNVLAFSMIIMQQFVIYIGAIKVIFNNIEISYIYIYI